MTRARRALVVDDEVQMVRTLCDILRLRGWETFGAASGPEAIEQFRARDVDVVLMDVKMQGMSGVDTLRELRGIRPSVPVILMTAYSTAELLAEAEREGAMKILAKPVIPATLVPLLEEAAQAHRRVLVVDDNPEFLSTLSAILQTQGYDVLRANSLDDALSLLSEQSPGAVILDLRLHDIAPVASVLAIRRADPSVVLILYSGSDPAAEPDANALFNKSARAILRKPFAPRELLGVLEEAFGD